MNKNILYLLVALLAFPLVGCEKSDDDMLTGKWQMRYQIEPDGTTTQVDTIYYNFDMGVFALQQSNNSIYYYGMYELTADMLDMQVKALRVETEDSIIIYPHWGSDSRLFDLEKLTSTTLHLSYNDTIYQFRKF